MKKNLFVLVAIVLILPLVLSACGGGPVKNAENFVKAISDADKDKAEKYVCDDFKDELDQMTGEKTEIDDLKCEEKDDNVTCSWKSDGQEIELTFTMKDDKVCGIEFPTE